MSKTKPAAAKKSGKPSADESKDKKKDDEPKDGMRETIESVVVAFMLAFLFRTFEAEAFVIPTGSMAPTLMGLHKDTVCPKCGFTYRVGVDEKSQDEEPATPQQGRNDVLPTDENGNPTSYTVASYTCPNCRFEAEYGPDRPPHLKSYKGDRIIVSKFPYEFNDPERWDVAVFKYPAQSKTNFIKRIVGLPNETVRVEHGDLHTRPKGVETFTIARKPPNKVRAILQVVYDNDFVDPDAIQKGWPVRWAPQAPLGEGSWQTSGDYRQFKTSGKAGETRLVYQHFSPTPEDWKKLEQGPLSDVARQSVRPQLISDFYAYDSRLVQRWNPRFGSDAENRINHDHFGMHWVGDLAVECEVTTQTGAGEVALELVEGGRVYQCRIELATGVARLEIPDLPAYKPEAQTIVQGAGTHTLMFANVDDQLFLWVDGDVVDFNQPTAYTGLPWQPPNGRDLAPAGIVARQAEVTVEHLRVHRDVYYIADYFHSGRSLYAPMSDYVADFVPTDTDKLPSFLRPASPQSVQLPPMRGPVEFDLDGDRYLAMGDNSPRSKDSRLWAPPEHYVNRDLLIGKALFIYWPHAWAPDWAVTLEIPWIGPIDLPFYPNFKRMRFVR